MTMDTKEKINNNKKNSNQVVSILPLKSNIVYPYLVVPLMIQDVEQTRLVDDALMRGSRIGLFLQKDPNVENPGTDDIYEIGTSGNILKMLRFPDGSVRFLIQGLSRIKIKKFVSNTPYLAAEVEELEENTTDNVRMEAFQRNLMDAVKNLGLLAPYLTEEFHISAVNQDAPSKLVDYVASNLNISIEQKQKILQELDIEKRMQNLYQMLQKEIEVLQLSQQIQEKAASELGKTQRDYILREQLKAIKKELGHGDDSSEIGEFERKIKEAKMPKFSEEAARKELDRLSHMAPSSA
ncbi:MAG: endopeptidase La, partial [Candidatus Zixiibacteriota bacterium]